MAYLQDLHKLAAILGSFNKLSVSAVSTCAALPPPDNVQDEIKRLKKQIKQNKRTIASLNQLRREELHETSSWNDRNQPECSYCTGEDSSIEPYQETYTEHHDPVEGYYDRDGRAVYDLAAISIAP